MIYFTKWSLLRLFGYVLNGKKDSEEKWIVVFRHFKDYYISVANPRKVMEYILCQPVYFSLAERAFSRMNTIWSEERSTMKKSGEEGLSTCKLNISLSCSMFYSKI